jgi:hypothetical protein
MGCACVCEAAQIPLLGNNHTAAPQRVTPHSNLFLIVSCVPLCVVSTIQSDGMHSAVCYVPSFARKCCVTLRVTSFLDIR